MVSQLTEAVLGTEAVPAGEDQSTDQKFRNTLNVFIHLGQEGNMIHMPEDTQRDREVFRNLLQEQKISEQEIPIYMERFEELIRGTQEAWDRFHATDAKLGDGSDLLARVRAQSGR